MAYSSKTIICTSSMSAEALASTALKFVIISSDANLVQMADDVAQQSPQGDRRIAVWVKDVDKQKLKEQFPTLSDVEEVIAFSISSINKVAFVFYNGEPANELRIDRAFIKARKTQYNL